MLYVIAREGDRISPMLTYMVWDSDDLSLENDKGRSIKALYNKNPSLFGNLSGTKGRLSLQLRVKDYVHTVKYNAPVMCDNCVAYAVPIGSTRRMGIWFNGAFHDRCSVANKDLTSNMPIIIKDGRTFVVDAVYGVVPVEYSSSMQMPFEVFHAHYLK